MRHCATKRLKTHFCICNTNQGHHSVCLKYVLVQQSWIPWVGKTCETAGSYQFITADIYNFNILYTHCIGKLFWGSKPRNSHYKKFIFSLLLRQVHYLSELFASPWWPIMILQRQEEWKYFAHQVQIETFERFFVDNRPGKQWNTRYLFKAYPIITIIHNLNLSQSTGWLVW